MSDKPSNKKTSFLEQRAVRSFGWRIGSSATSIVFQFAVGVVLARLLPPEDFGLIGLAWIVIRFADLIVSLGMGPALIQRKSITGRHIRVAFTLSVLTSLLMGIALFSTAPFFAGILNDTRVIPILRLLSVTFALSGAGIVSDALLSRDFAFRQLFVAGIISLLLYAITAIGLAFAGYGVWSLACAALLQTGTGSLVAYLYVRHPILPLIDTKATKELTSFGAGISLASVLNYFALQGDYFAVGRVLGPGSLGIYTRAYSLMTFTTKQFVQAIGSVLFPALSSIQDEPQRFKRAYMHTLSMTGFVAIPVSFAMFVLAPDIIHGIYGEKWVEAILPFQILSVFGGFRALYNVQANFIRAKGFVHQIVLYQATYAILVICGAFFGVKLAGLPGVAAGVGISIFIVWALASYFANQLSGIQFKNFCCTLRPGLVIGLIVLLSCTLVKWYMKILDLGPLWILFCALSAGIMASVLALFRLPQNLFLHLPERIILSLEEALPISFQPALECLRRWIVHPNRGTVPI